MDVRRVIPGLMARFAAVAGSQAEQRWQLPNLVMPTYDINSYLDSRADITLSQASQLVAVSSVNWAVLNVPQNQIWLLKGAGVQQDSPVASTTSVVSLSVLLSGVAAEFPLTDWSKPGLNGQYKPFQGFVPAFPFALNPGDQLRGLGYNGDAAVARTVYLTALYRIIDLASL